MNNPRHLYISCPLCDSPFTFLKSVSCTGHAMYNSDLPPTMKWNTCNACSHIFTDGYWTEEALASLFKKTHSFQQTNQNPEVMRVINSRIVDRVVSFSDEPLAQGSWLDVGFGDGALLFTAQEFGYDVVGLDLRGQNVKDVKDMGLEAYPVDIETFEAPQDSFSVVSLADLIEHTPFPKRTLGAASDLLKNGGLLFLSCPNMDTVIWKSLDMLDRNPYWFEIEHYHNFDRRSMYRLLNETGFEVLHYGISERYRSCMEIIAVAR